MPAGHKSIEFLDSSGHLALTWDASDPESVAQAQAEFDQLAASGYTFFWVIEQAVPAFDPSLGKLEARRVAAEDVRPRLLTPVAPVATDEAPRRRGRPKGSTNRPKGERVVAARPMAGG